MSSASPSKVVVECDECGGEITDRKDLMITSVFLVWLRKYHRICYAEREKSIFHQLFFKDAPLNWGLGKLAAGLSPILALILAVVFGSNMYHQFRPPPPPQPIVSMWELEKGLKCLQKDQQACEDLRNGPPYPPIEPPLTQEQTLFIILASTIGLLLGGSPGILYLVGYYQWERHLEDSTIQEEFIDFKG
jgi:hypothetical protein